MRLHARGKAGADAEDKQPRIRGKANLLSAKYVAAEETPGTYADGDRLFLLVRDVGGRITKSWVFRYTSPAGKRRDMGLGSLDTVSLAKARELAAEKRLDLLRDIDPLEVKHRTRADARAQEEAQEAEADRQAMTLARFSRQYHETIQGTYRNAKHRQQWINSLEQHVPTLIWHKPLTDVTAADLIDFLRDLQQRLPETGRRVRQRLETVYAEAVVRGLCANNPAAAVRKSLRAKRPRTHFAALPYAEVPQLVQDLRATPGNAARALEFALLTAARTSEVLLATFDEFDLKRGIWTVPASRMKAGEAHVVYLHPRAVEIVKHQPRTDYVFASPNDDERPLSNMALLMTLRRLGVGDRTTAHGLCRASFSTWANENGHRPDAIEASLAHRESNLTRAAYNRAQFLDARKALMTAWGDYCCGVKRRGRPAK